MSEEGGARLLSQGVEVGFGVSQGRDVQLGGDSEGG